MKNSFKMLSLLLIVCLLVVGCGKKKDKKEEQLEPTPIVYGEEYQISLAAYNSDGYDWKYEITGDDILVLSYTYDPSCEDINVDCTGSEIYSIKSSAKGNAILTFKFTSPNNEVIKEAIYNITVDDKLNITETHTGSYFE